MFGIGMPELILILAIALIVIGPKKLPDLAKSLGRAMREFKKATSELKGSLELDDDIKEVRTAFDGVRSDIKDSVREDTPGAGPDAALDRKVTDLEKGYEDWQQDRSSKKTGDTPAGSDPGPEKADAPREAEAEKTHPDDASKKKG